MDYLNVNQFDRRNIFVIPGPVIKELTKKLNGRLSPIFLLQGHVHIIHKHYKLLAKWWAIHSCNKNVLQTICI
jgi:hypothetical protein